MITFFSFLSQQRSDINKSHMMYSRKRGFGPFSQLQHLMEFKQKNKGNFETKQLVLCLSVCDLHVWCTNENKRAMRGLERLKKNIYAICFSCIFALLQKCARKLRFVKVRRRCLSLPTQILNSMNSPARYKQFKMDRAEQEASVGEPLQRTSLMVTYSTIVSVTFSAPYWTR